MEGGHRATTTMVVQRVVERVLEVELRVVVLATRWKRKFADGPNTTVER